MTRARAGRGEVATPLMAQYYQQRASAALIISESTQVSAQGRGCAWTPGLHTDVQVAAWRQVTDAVHAAGGCMFAQLWHAGAMSHSSLQPGGAAPVSASASPVKHMHVFVDPHGYGAGSGLGMKVEPSVPRALTIPEIEAIVGDFTRAARNALEAGFDGVEVHGGNGYLLQQFLDAGSNHRDDRYGGGLENRMRLLRDTVGALISAVGGDRVGVRLSPLRPGAALGEYLTVARTLDSLEVGYLHLADGGGGDALPVTFKHALRNVYRGALMYSGGYTLARAEEALRNGWSDLIGFGRAFIANPDLPYRLRCGLPLSPSEPGTYYGGDAKGYTDYPCAAATAIDHAAERA